MPNHTTNLLTIVGEKHIRGLLKPFLSQEKTTTNVNGLVLPMEDENELQDTIFLDLNKIIPMPKEIEEITKYSDVNFIMQKRTPEQKKKDNAKE